MTSITMHLKYQRRHRLNQRRYHGFREIVRSARSGTGGHDKEMINKEEGKTKCQ